MWRFIKRTKEAYEVLCECQLRTLMNNTLDAINQEGELFKMAAITGAECGLKVGDKNN